MPESLFINVTLVVLSTVYLAWRGFHRGVIRTLQRFMALACAYASCYFLTIPVAHLLQQQFGLSVLPATVLSAIGLFFGISIIIGFIIGLMATFIENRGVEPAHIPGAAIGGVLGLLLGLLLVWLGGMLWDGIRLKNPANRAGMLAEQDPLRTSVGKAIGGIAEHVLDGSADSDNLLPKVTGELLSNPVKMSQQLMEVSNSEAMKQFFADPFARHAMLTSQPEILMNNANFQALMADPETATLFAALGDDKKMAKDRVSDNASDKEKAARVLTNLYQRSTRIQTDKRFIKLQESGQFKSLAESKSVFDMVRQPGFTALGEIILDATREKAPLVRIEKPQWVSTTVEQSAASASSVAGEASSSGKQDTPVIYRWRDESGKRHYSENKPEGGFEVEVISQ